MLYVTVGSVKNIFTRLQDELLKLPDDIKSQIFYQGQVSEEFAKQIKSEALLTREEHQDYLSKAELVISHAGVGTILDCLKLNKKMIVFPRLAEYGEHYNNHQSELIEQLEVKPLPGVTCLIELKLLSQVINKVISSPRYHFLEPPKELRHNISQYVNSLFTP